MCLISFVLNNRWSLRNIRVGREKSSSEDQNHERSEQERIWIGYIEFARIGEDGSESLSVCRPIRDQHVTRQQQRDGPGKQAEHEKDTAYEFQRGDERGVEGWEWDIEAGEEARDLCKVV